MSDELTTAISDNADSASATSAPTEKALTASDVQEMIRQASEQARNAAFAEARRTFEGKQPKQKPAKDEAKHEPSMSELLQLRDVFDDSIESVAFPNKKAKAKMREEFLASRPQEADAWIADYAETMGWTKAEANEVKQPINQKPTNATPASNAGAPASSSMGEAPRDVLSWTEEDVNAYFYKNAKVPGNRYDIRNRPVIKELRRMTEAALAQRRIYIGPQKVK